MESNKVWVVLLNTVCYGVFVNEDDARELAKEHNAHVQWLNVTPSKKAALPELESELNDLFNFPDLIKKELNLKEEMLKDLLLPENLKKLHETPSSPQDICDHGVTFDEVAFNASGNKPWGASYIRKNYPRLHGKCPKGCGYNGIAYASFLHYIAGDW